MPRFSYTLAVSIRIMQSGRQAGDHAEGRAGMIEFKRRKVIKSALYTYISTESNIFIERRDIDRQDVHIYLKVRCRLKFRARDMHADVHAYIDADSLTDSQSVSSGKTYGHA